MMFVFLTNHSPKRYNESIIASLTMKNHGIKNQ